VESSQTHPKEAKMELANQIVATFYDSAAAASARNEFVQVTQENQLPSDIAEFKIAAKTLGILDLLVAVGAAVSKSEAKRLVLQNGVKINSQIKNNWKEEIEIKNGQIIQVGKSRFFKVAS